MYRRGSIIPIRPCSDEPRTAPPFCVFWQSGAWCVCTVTSEGEPLAVFEGHANVQLAIDQAEQLNRWATKLPPPEKETVFGRLVRWLKATACGRAQ